MSGKTVMLDTNVLIYYLKGHSALEKYYNSYFPYISFITEIETLSSSSLSGDEFDIMKDFFLGQTIVEYLPEFRDIIISIRSKKKLKLPDAIIAATAIYYQCPLVTSDKAFKNIDGLELIYYEPPAI